MKEFEFELCINARVCGSFSHEGSSEEDAYEKAQQEIDAIMVKLPVDVEYSIGVI